MRISEILESATAGATSAANVGVGAVYKNKPGKTAKGNGMQALYLTTVPIAIGVIVTHNGRLYYSPFATKDR